MLDGVIDVIWHNDNADLREEVLTFTSSYVFYMVSLQLYYANYADDRIYIKFLVRTTGILALAIEMSEYDIQVLSLLCDLSVRVHVQRVTEPPEQHL